MKPSPACYALTRASENCVLHAYQDTGGVWTIGIGHTRGVKPGQVITAEQAEAFLEADMADAAEMVNRLALPCTQGQFDALTDFAFNVGEKLFAPSTLLRMHKAGNYTLAALQFARWKYDNGKVQAGLVKRRAAETHLYLSDNLPPGVS